MGSLPIPPEVVSYMKRLSTGNVPTQSPWPGARWDPRLVDAILRMAESQPQRIISGFPVGPRAEHLPHGAGRAMPRAPVMQVLPGQGARVLPGHAEMWDHPSSARLATMFDDIMALDSALPEVAQDFKGLFYTANNNPTIGGSTVGVYSPDGRWNADVTEAVARRYDNSMDISGRVVPKAMTEHLDEALRDSSSKVTPMPVFRQGEGVPGQSNYYMLLKGDPRNEIIGPDGKLKSQRYMQQFSLPVADVEARIGRSLTPAHEYGHLTLHHLMDDPDPEVRKMWREWADSQRLTTAQARANTHLTKFSTMAHHAPMESMAGDPDFWEKFRKGGQRSAVYGDYGGREGLAAAGRGGFYADRRGAPQVPVSPEPGDTMRSFATNTSPHLNKKEYAAYDRANRARTGITSLLSGSVSPHEAFAENTALKVAANDGDALAKRLLSQPFARNLDDLLARTKRLKPGFGGGLLGIVAPMVAAPALEWIGDRLGIRAEASSPR